MYQPSLKAPLHDCIVKDNQVEVSIQVPGLTSMENSELKKNMKSASLKTAKSVLSLQNFVKIICFRPQIKLILN